MTCWSALAGTGCQHAFAVYCQLGTSGPSLAAALQALQAVDGYEQVEQRRRSKYDKKIYSGAHVGAMDTGVDAK